MNLPHIPWRLLVDFQHCTARTSVGSSNETCSQAITGHAYSKRSPGHTVILPALNLSFDYLPSRACAVVSSMRYQLVCTECKRMCIKSVVQGRSVQSRSLAE